MPNAQLPQGLSIASMVLGIVSLAINCCGIVGIPCGIIAIAFGGVALSKCKKGEAGGKGMAVAGLVCGIITVSFGALLCILWMLGTLASPMGAFHQP
jgi:hypothetical protein